MNSIDGANALQSPANESEFAGVPSMAKTSNDYYRPAVLIPQEAKDRVQQRAKELGVSVSSYILNLIQADIGDIDRQEYGHPGKGRRTPKN